MSRLFVKRSERPSLVKDFLKSKRAEREWSRHRMKMETAVRQWHHSTEGRKVHRQIGRYLALRTFQDSLNVFYPRED